MQKPKMLRPGDHVALLALSSPAKSPEEVDSAVRALEGYGLRVHRGASLTLSRDYLAGSAAERTRDVARALKHKDMRGLFFLRGGYGSAQLLGGIDFEEIARRQILVAGFSDLTSILNACVRAKIASLHLPTMASHFVAHPPTARVDRAFRALAFGEEPLGSLRDVSAAPAFEAIHPGSAKGVLVGGNLTVFTTLIGTPWMPNPKGKILFLEEVGETPYRIDRMLTHLRNCGYLEKLSGIVLGQFTNCRHQKPERWTWRRAVEEALAGLRVPTITGLPCGHGHPSFPLPLGVRCSFSSKEGDLYFGEKLVIAR